MARKVLVTGSTQGIGKAIAKAFVQIGDEVFVHCARDMNKAESVRAEIDAAHAVVADLLEWRSVNELYAKTGAVDCLIINASVQYKQTWDKITDDAIDQQIDINIKSTVKLMTTYYPAMKEKHFGRIVMIGSVNQHRRHSELALYSATKCADMSLVKNLAKQVAPFGVTVNNISPGAIVTPRNADVYGDEKQRKAVESLIPMGHFGTPEDCVGAVLLLCSAQGSYITGADIAVDGGMGL